MNKKLMKVLSVVLVVMTLVTISTSVFAEFTPGSVTPTDLENDSKVVTTGNQIVGAIRTIGMIASVAILMVLGIKYMMGSAEEKAEYKKTFIPYIVGALLLFAAAALAENLYNVFSNWGK